MTELDTTFLDELFVGQDTAVARDLKLNLKRFLGQSTLAPDEALLTLLATATSVGSSPLACVARAELVRLDLKAEQIQEAAESAAIMGMLNVYYRFRHLLAAGLGQETVEADYGTAGLRMNALAKPSLGKERFEMLAFAVSVLNGCGTCITSHARALATLGVTTEKIHDLARLAATVQGVARLS